MPRSFVGREDDLRRLAVAVDEAMAGHGSLVLVVGEPGIGKTRLAEEAASQASAAGTEVRWASCWESEGTPAYWPWAQLIRAHAEERDEATLAGELGTLGDLALALVPDVARRLSARATELRLAPGADSEPARLQLFEAVTALFRRAAASRPLLLVLDDVHWADTASLLLLHFAARELRRSRVLLLATYRDVEVHAGSERNRLLTQLGQEGRILILEGLDEEAVSQLLALTTGARPDSGLVADVHRRSAGNPLFVLELARLVSEQGRLGLAAGDLSIPGGVRVVLERRLGRLSPSCLEALSAAAVAGQEFQLDLLARTTRLPLERLLDLLDEARRAHLITSPEAPTGRWAFGHTLVREVLYERLPLARRAALHRATGEALLEARDPERHLAELAHHFLSAGTPGDAYRAVVYGERAGQRALDLLAYEEGAASFERALEALDLCSEDGERRVELLLALGDARLRAGDLAAARDAFEEAARWARRRQRPDELARAALGFGAGLSGFEVRLFDTRQLDLLEEALLALGPEDSPLRAWTLARLSVALSFVASEERRRALAEEAVAMARRLEDRAALAYALGSHCDAIAGPSQAEERKAEATEIVRLAQETGDRGTELLGRRLRLVALLELGDMPAADAEVENFARTAEALRQPLYLWYVPLWRGMRALMEGRLADCERHQVEAEASGRGPTATTPPWGSRVSA